MKYSLYVVAHKEIENVFPDNRKIMMVGAYNKQVPAGYYSDFDETKDNISHKNANYCELTGFYYMCKHDDADILGLEHYRRAFVKKYGLFNYSIIKQKEIDKLLKKYDAILPQRYDLKMSVREFYKRSHIEDDLDIVKSVITEKYPMYLDSFNAVMKQHTAYFYNMFIAKKEIIKDYADWLFDILFEVEKRIDISNRDDYQKRIFGFLSERLLTVYFYAHPEIKIKDLKVLMIENGKPTRFIVRVIRKIKQILKLK